MQNHVSPFFIEKQFQLLQGSDTYLKIEFVVILMPKILNSLLDQMI
jgi:hypothetical protein